MESKSILLRSKGIFSGEISLKELTFHLRSVLPLPVLFLLVLWSNPTGPWWWRGLPLVLLGECIRLWGAGYVGRHRYADASDKDEVLVTAGPYAHVRHPLYLGNLLIGFGFVLVINWWLGYLCLLMFMWVAHWVVIPVEEAVLLRKHPREYEIYSEWVPKYIPRLSGYPGAQGHYSWAVALGSEKQVFWLLLVLGGAIGVKLLF